MQITVTLGFETGVKPPTKAEMERAMDRAIIDLQDVLHASTWAYDWTFPTRHTDPDVALHVKLQKAGAKTLAKVRKASS